MNEALAIVAKLLQLSPVLLTENNEIEKGLANTLDQVSATMQNKLDYSLIATLVWIQPSTQSWECVTRLFQKLEREPMSQLVQCCIDLVSHTNATIGIKPDFKYNIIVFDQFTGLDTSRSIRSVR
jgi:hypothetical protein